jgi:FtsP/CotA-like multicopper oxidase with cupredoxin domain
VRHGLQAPVPDLDPRPVLSMADMGHGHHLEHDINAPAAPAADPHAGHAMPAASDPHAGHAMPSHQPAAGPHAGHDMGGMPMQAHPASERNNPLVDMQTMTPSPKLDDPGTGLRNNGGC